MSPNVSRLTHSYFMNNNFDGNQLIASYILPSGKLVAGAAVYTEGNGSASINDPAPFQNHVRDHPLCR